MSDAILFPGERRLQGRHYPVLAWHRAGAADRPLLVLAPGGGHLARIFYGHPGGEARDFLAHSLGALGYELLALSYPSDHPAIRASCAGMTIGEWARDCVAAVAQMASPEREIVLIGWSMAGRLARVFRVAALAHGLRCERFVSLAATPLLPNLTSPREGGEPLTSSALWDSSTRDVQWRREIADRRHPDGREPIPLEIYLRHYRCDTPVRLRGETREGMAQPYPLTALLEELRPYDYADYPLSASIAPTEAADARHALTDEVSWGFLNMQMIYCEAARRLPGGFAALTRPEWQALRERLAGLPARLTRAVEGNHFFFVGENGARQTARHVHDLLGEMQSICAWRASLPERP